MNLLIVLHHAERDGNFCERLLSRVAGRPLGRRGPGEKRNDHGVNGDYPLVQGTKRSNEFTQCAAEPLSIAVSRVGHDLFWQMHFAVLQGCHFSNLLRVEHVVREWFASPRRYQCAEDSWRHRIGS